MATQPETRYYDRFTLAQRLEHWIMVLSFTVLVITGLPQRYAQADWANFMIEAMGGIEAVRIIHRLAAILFMLSMLYHFMVVAYKVLVLRVPLTMMLTIQDAKDLINSVRYYLGLTSDHPKLPRYNFAEKIEYWAVIWGGVLMTVTGFMLWNPIATTSFLPGEFIPASRAAHSAEALLAFLAIIIWHFYWVHLKTFNRSIFSGKLSREQMEMEHAAELEQIEAGKTFIPPSPIVLRQRERIFMPATAVVTVIALIALYFFVTFERTAITTIPPAEPARAFVPATPTPTNTPQPTPTPTATPIGGQALPVSVPIISHPIEGREDCFECHGPGGFLPNPPGHENYDLSTCEVCHAIDQEKPGPAPITHKLVEREQCTSCHELDLQPESHWEADFSDRECFLCHQTPAQ